MSALQPFTLESVPIITAVCITRAERIVEQHQLAEQHKEQAVDHAIRCGELLIQQRDSMGYGGFRNWISVNCPQIGQSTATRYMKAAEHFATTGSKPSSLRWTFPSGRPGGLKKTQKKPISEECSRVTEVRPFLTGADDTRHYTKALLLDVLYLARLHLPDSDVRVALRRLSEAEQAEHQSALRWAAQILLYASEFCNDNNSSAPRLLREAIATLTGEVRP
jgi:hypothetical protein